MINHKVINKRNFLVAAHENSIQPFNISISVSYNGNSVTQMGGIVGLLNASESNTILLISKNGTVSIENPNRDWISTEEASNNIVLFKENIEHLIHRGAILDNRQNVF